MNYTANYHLTQWEKDDHIMMDDFNENNAKIDAALAEKPFVMGTYTGNGKTKDEGGQSITLGFQPSFVIATGSHGGGGFYCRSGAIAEENANCGRLTGTGFHVWSNEATADLGNLNAGTKPYWYVAFR